MLEFLHSMAWPFLACLILTGIHVYLGIHVLSRRVIFVDLALAQVAALGSVWGVLLGWDLDADPWHIKAFSLGFTFLGAAIFSITRMRSERVPHEALIGISYAVAVGATILASSHLAHGAEEVSELLAGSILWVRPGMLAATAVLYAAVGLFHWLFRKKFFLISLHPDEAEAQGLSIRVWDFLFYVSFGFVVTSSVSIAGVILVFSFLVIPAVIAALFVDGIRSRLVVGWCVGSVVSAIGCTLSYFRDLPSGPAIVACFGGALLLAGFLRYVMHAPRPSVAFVKVVAGTGGIALFLWGTTFFRKVEHHDVAKELQTGTRGERMLAVAEVEADPSLWDKVHPLVHQLLPTVEPQVRARLLDLVEAHHAKDLLPDVVALLGDEDDMTRERALRTVKELGGKESADALVAAAQKEDDEYLRVELGEALLELGDPRGFGFLVDIVLGGEAAQARRDAWEHLTAHADLDQGLAAVLPPKEDPTARRALQAWWAKSEGHFAPAAGGRFEVDPGNG